MSFLKSTSDLKNEVLTICGELTDGSSQFESDVIRYLNDLYQGVLAGGNEFGIEVAENWVWAQAKKPIVLSLVPAEEGEATLTNGSRNGTFSSAPTESLVGRYFRVDARADIYRISSHAAGDTAFSLDQEYLQDSGVLNFMAFKFDYDLVDDTIVIDSSNNKIDFRDASSSTLTATLTVGTYDPTSLCTEIEARMLAVGSAVYTASFNELNRRFTIESDGAYFDLVFASGPNVEISASEVLGYDIEDLQDALSYTSTYSLSAILRLTKPVTMYRESPMYYGSARDVGKIFLVDDNTFLREFPLNRLEQKVPDKFCPIEISNKGLWKVRFNGSVLDEPIRAEVNYIKVPRKLVDNENSYPLIPGSYTKYLVFGAAHYILSDKSDNKAVEYAQKAAAKLQAMINDARASGVKAGQNFGRLIPRAGSVRALGFNK